ncbi:transposase, partial [Acetobacter cerevisiae]
MIPLPSGLKIWLAAGATDMRLGMPGLALRVQQFLGRDPYAGDVFVFRGRRGDLVKLIWHDGIGRGFLTLEAILGHFVEFS